MSTCIHCDERASGAEGTVYCQPCLDWGREAYAAQMNGTLGPSWDLWDPDDIEARYPSLTPTPEGGEHAKD